MGFPMQLPPRGSGPGFDLWAQVEHDVARVEADPMAIVTPLDATEAMVGNETLVEVPQPPRYPFGRSFPTEDVSS